MSQYQASIGRSSYEIPYESQDDLPLLQTICKEVNRLVNSVIASNPPVSNEFALVLALINTIYETGYTTKMQESYNELQYSKQNIIEIIELLQRQL
jgi:hypothetical protein